jgi:hypothetical protein
MKLNLDTMTFDELDALWRGFCEHPRRLALILFPTKPPLYVRTTGLLALYASDRIRAMQYHSAGHLEDARKVEEAMAQLYKKLPGYARW